MTHEVAAAGGALLNLCSQDVLLELLRFLKRAYWPFAWDSSGGPESGGEAAEAYRPSNATVVSFHSSLQFWCENCAVEFLTPGQSIL